MFYQLLLYRNFEAKSSHARAMALRTQIKGLQAEAKVYWTNHFYYARRANKIAEMTGAEFTQWVAEARIDLAAFAASVEVQ
jgi:hypothetical protein